MIALLNKIISKILEIFVERPSVKNKIKSKNAQRIINLYSTTPYTRNFVKFRFWFGPLLEINNLVPKVGTVTDFGSGEGILANFLAISSPKRKITGIEISKNRIKEANKGIKNIKFITGSALKVKTPKTDTVVISHVLHHLGNKKRQEELLRIAHDKIKKGGQVVIAEVDKEFSLAYLFGYIVDIFLVPVFFEKKFLDLKIDHRNKKEWIKVFQKLGFKVNKMQITKDRIYPEVIFVLTK